MARNMYENATILTNEDDVFRILSKPDIHRMVVLHRKWVSDNQGAEGKYDQRKNIDFAVRYGWDWIEYLIARKIAGYAS